jgi:membrane protein
MWLTRIKQMLLRQSPEDMGIVRKAGLRLVQFGVFLQDQFFVNKCPHRAAALTYTTILSVFPFIALLTLIAPVFVGGTTNIEDAVIGFMDKSLVPAASEDIQQTVQTYFQAFRENASTIGLFGAAGLVLACLVLFSTVEKTFNEVWYTGRRRSFLRIFSSFTAIVICAPVLIGISIFLTSLLELYGRVVGRALLVIVPYAFTSLALTLGYYLIPNAPVRFRSALIGGLIAGALWEVAKLTFGFYVVSPRISIFFKSIGAVPIFLVWLYFLWNIVLLGNEVSYVSQHFGRLRRKAMLETPPQVVDSRVVLAVLLLIANQFRNNRGGATSEELADRLLIPDTDLNLVLHNLEEAKLITSTAEGMYVMARPIENIHVSQLLQLGCNISGVFRIDEDERGLMLALEHVHQSSISWPGRMTVKTLLEQPLGA